MAKANLARVTGQPQATSPAQPAPPAQPAAKPPSRGWSDIKDWFKRSGWLIVAAVATFFVAKLVFAPLVWPQTGVRVSDQPQYFALPDIKGWPALLFILIGLGIAYFAAFRPWRSHRRKRKQDGADPNTLWLVIGLIVSAVFLTGLTLPYVPVVSTLGILPYLADALCVAVVVLTAQWVADRGVRRQHLATFAGLRQHVRSLLGLVAGIVLAAALFSIPFGTPAASSEAQSERQLQIACASSTQGSQYCQAAAMVALANRQAGDLQGWAQQCAALDKSVLKDQAAACHQALKARVDKYNHRTDGMGTLDVTCNALHASQPQTTEGQKEAARQCAQLEEIKS
ncbi:MAG TPA: hypothetical protein VLF67_00910 [Candidatus Saccharimonas sp.]|nr:hypothetical protein [Candidatus Saccharimonas sp.]